MIISMDAHSDVPDTCDGRTVLKGTGGKREQAYLNKAITATNTQAPSGANVSPQTTISAEMILELPQM